MLIGVWDLFYWLPTYLPDYFVMIPGVRRGVAVVYLFSIFPFTAQSLDLRVLFCTCFDESLGFGVIIGHSRDINRSFSVTNALRIFYYILWTKPKT